MLCTECGFDHAHIREACRRSLFLTATLLCGFSDLTSKFHGRVCNWLEDNLATGKPRMMILLPRGTFKSSLATISGAIWFLIRNPEARILLIQQSGKKSEQTMSAISGRLLSENFRHFFPELIPEKRERWNQSDIVINRTRVSPEASVSARGIDSRIVGGHYEIIILDDPIDLKEAESELEMASAVQFFDHLEPFIEPPDKGIEIVIGTRWAADDLYQHVIDMGQHEVMESGIVTDSRSAKWAFSPPNAPIFPERYSAETVSKIRQRMSSYAFACQYMNRPYSDGVQRFPKECIQYYNWREPGKTLQIGEEVISTASLKTNMTVDPSLGEKKSADESAITVVGMDSKARIIVLEAWSGRVNPIGLINQIFALQEKWTPQRVGVESVGYQKALSYFMRQEMQQRGKFFSITELKTGGHKKEVRIEGLSPFFTNKQVFIPRSAGKLEKQLLDFPSSQGHDDLIDSLSYHTPWWRVAQQVEKNEEDLEDWTQGRPAGPAYGLRCS